MNVESDANIEQIQSESHFRCISASYNIPFRVFLCDFGILYTSQSERDGRTYVWKNIYSQTRIEIQSIL